jgi:hypothetical protein
MIISALCALSNAYISFFKTEKAKELDENGVSGIWDSFSFALKRLLVKHQQLVDTLNKKDVGLIKL